MNFLFELPLWIVLVVLAAGVGVFIAGNNRVNARIRMIGLAVVAIGLGLGAVSYFGQTPREECVSRTKQIVAAVRAKDWDALKPLLDRNTQVMLLRGPDQIADGLAALERRFGLNSLSILALDGTASSAGIEVKLSVFSEHNFGPSRSIWRLEFEPRSDGILLARIVPEQIGERGEPGNLKALESWLK